MERKTQAANVEHEKSKEVCRRAFDVVAANIGICALLLARKIYGSKLEKETGGDFFFYQHRMGKDGKPFVIVKLQTISQKKDTNGDLLPEEQRIGPIGAKLRKYKVDELPQFLNVLRGEMSTVGPRPHIISDDISCVKRRHELLPGVTGLGKLIAGNNNSHLEELKGDCRYRRKCKALGVVRFAFYNASIILKTPFVILNQRNAPTSYSVSGQSTDIRYRRQLCL